MKKNILLYSISTGLLIGIYFLFETSVYRFDWYFGSKAVKGIKFYFISNPPTDKFEMLNLIVKHIKEEKEIGNLSNTNMVYYIEETWETNRFYNINEYWSLDEAWMDMGIIKQIGHFILTSNDWYNVDKSFEKLNCEKSIELVNYTSIPDTTNRKLKYGTDYRNYYFMDGILNNPKKHWLRVYYHEKNPIYCDTNFIPKELIKGKYKFL